MERYRSINAYLRQKFGCKVYKLALDGGMTCPNRDGTLDTRGCIFCNGGSGEFAEGGNDLSFQLERAKARLAGKTDAERFIAYFQSYTNTYAPIEKLKRLFYPVIERPEIAALSIGTRPDCLPENVLALIEELNGIKPVFVELGLQTIHEESAALIRRGYPLVTYDEAIKNLKDTGAETVTHIILGLPRESADDMEETVRYVGKSGTDGVKLQLLHVLRGTDLEQMFMRGEFAALTFEEYARILCRCIEALPPQIVIHRLTGDAPKRLLAAPAWSADKKRVLNGLKAEFEKQNIIQGRTAMH